MLLGFDVSGHQGTVNFAAAASASRGFAIIKATEGVGWTDPDFAVNRRNAHAAGLIVGLYHFARPDTNSPDAEAAYFSGVIGPLQPNEFVCFDWERAYTGDHVAWSKTWLDDVRRSRSTTPFIYLNQGEERGQNWAPVASTYPLWLAAYDGTTAQPSVPYWGAPRMKQYSDAGTVLGVSGPVDVNVFFGDASQLAAYGAGGADVPLTQQDLDAIWSYPLQGINGIDANGNPTVGPVPAGTRLANTDTKTAQLELHPHSLNTDLRGWCDNTGKAVADVQSKVGAPAPVMVDAASFVAALKADPDAMNLLAKAFAAAAAPAVIAELGNVIHAQTPPAA